MSGDNAAVADAGRAETASGGRELPVLPTIVRGYRETLLYLPTYLIQAALWACSVGALEYALEVVVAPALRAREIVGPLAAAVRSAAPFAEIFALLLSTVAIALSAYRAAIKGERPRWQRAMHFGRRELRFLGLTLVFCIIEYGGVLLLMLLPLTVAHVTGEDRLVQRALATPYAAALLQLLVMVLGGVFISATMTPVFGLAFPLVAIDAPSGLLRRAARMSRGYRRQLAVISFLAMLPFAVASCLPYAWTPDTGTIGPSARDAAVALIGLVGVAFATTGFAVAFRTIAEGHSEGVYEVFD